MIRLSIDHESGLPPYLQLVRQVRQGMQVGLLVKGDRLPTINGLAAQLSINPNTVIKAYRELQYAGLVDARTGEGTFVGTNSTGSSLDLGDPLSQELRRWLTRACQAGLNDEIIEALFSMMLRTVRQDHPGNVSSER